MIRLDASDKIYVAPSQIKGAGRGVFAAKKIKRDELIESCPLIEVPRGDTSKLSESILVTYFFYHGMDKARLAIALGFGSIYNHSYSPNAKCKIKGREKVIEFTAIKDIHKDEEITFDYSFGNPKDKTLLWLDTTS